jgi:hypothetical protein
MVGWLPKALGAVVTADGVAILGCEVDATGDTVGALAVVG